MVGTIARKKRTLNKLLNKIEKVCSGELTPIPNKIKYLPYIEQSVDCIEENIEKMLTRKEKVFSKMDST